MSEHNAAKHEYKRWQYGEDQRMKEPLPFKKINQNTQ